MHDATTRWEPHHTGLRQWPQSASDVAGPPSASFPALPEPSAIHRLLRGRDPRRCSDSPNLGRVFNSSTTSAGNLPFLLSLFPLPSPPSLPAEMLSSRSGSIYGQILSPRRAMVVVAGSSQVFIRPPVPPLSGEGPRPFFFVVVNVTRLPQVGLSLGRESPPPPPPFPPPHVTSSHDERFIRDHRPRKSSPPPPPSPLSPATPYPLSLLALLSSSLLPLPPLPHRRRAAGARR